MNSINIGNHKTKRRETTLFLILLGIASAFDFASATESMISKMRVRKIMNIIKEYTSEKEKLTDPFVQKDILDRVAEDFTLEPDEKPNTKPVSEVAREVRKLVAKRFPNSLKKIKYKAKKEANQEFKINEKLDFVTVKVQKGRSIYSISGVFYGFGVGGKSVRIGDNLPIAMFDLSPTDRARFDRIFCEKIKKKYVSKKIRQYFVKKQSYLNMLFHDKLGAIARENEKLGYIYRWDKWRTPKDITENLIKQHIRQQHLHSTNQEDEPIEVANRPDKKPDTAVDNLDTPDKQPVSDPGGKPEKPGGKPADGGKNTKMDLRLSKLKNAIEKKQMEIAGSQYGIDADQMFRCKDKLVLIGMRRDEVNLVLSGLVSTNTGAEETITLGKGILNSATLYFINNILYKVKKDYRIGPPEAMKQLLNFYKDSYGDSLEDVEKAKKEKERLARLAKIKHLCKKHKWTPNGTCKTCHVKKVDLQPPKLALEQTLTWKGKIIMAQLQLALTPHLDNFTKFALTKENPNLKIDQERILKEIEREKAKEAKKKLMKEYVIPR